MADLDQRPQAAAKARVIAHMNADHKESLAFFCQYYSNLPSHSVALAQIEDMDLDHMIIVTNTSRNLIRIDPPMKSWAEARARMVKMDEEAIAGLGLSKIIINQYVPPKGFHLVVFILCVMTFILMSTRRNFLPGSIIYEIFLRGNRRIAKFLCRIQPFVLYPMLALHASEAIYLDQTRLKRHRVRRLTKRWCMWMASSFIEGIGAKQRFDKLVKKKILLQQAVKHIGTNL
ncbi:MAG: hypothetical protein M1824_005255 [Vezdaea acicularis]|nr:MAG: hypothetical protein M1824_005255 [Vezdaea acicularis]